MGDSVLVSDGEYKDTVGIVYSIKRGEGSKLYRISINDDASGSLDILVPRERFRSHLEDVVMDYTRGSIPIHEGPPAPHRMPIPYERIGLCHRDYKRLKSNMKFTNNQIVLYPYAKKSYCILSTNAPHEKETTT